MTPCVYRCDYLTLCTTSSVSTYELALVVMMGGHVMNWLRNQLEARCLQSNLAATRCAWAFPWMSESFPQILVTIWWTTFVLALAVLLSLGFGTRGVRPGSFAASYQGWMYGAFTPANGPFARLTSLGMLGFFAMAATIMSGICASSITILIWLFQGLVQDIFGVIWTV
ncbi:hypothetical protein AUEXF2481DRAFT_29702 [Aureobasidium subglaciale EXF-2481]|uniref:Uncharacterized protein n=1 Tax=Aureobasidium subglaciale (strain EXF-2481) TaxID=1043005 RepID=A0A074YAZ5_AURSE|nr:uncharacterized protein AUEXF2481DRAFT_29702 [Aureobasidium subglaciale EXF-2481]KEQ94973.1 hypothetical protein AUEXF2481DRAFT_29702 [Aureobasidium subglaciale EXF-2481]